MIRLSTSTCSIVWCCRYNSKDVLLKDAIMKNDAAEVSALMTPELVNATANLVSERGHLVNAIYPLSTMGKRVERLP